MPITTKKKKTLTALKPPSLGMATMIASFNPGIAVLYQERGMLGYVSWQDGKEHVTELSAVN